MNDSDLCFGRDSSLNELLHEPIIAMLMTSDGVRSDDIRALFSQYGRARIGSGRRGDQRARQRFERCFTP